ncbi:MAG: hypothetical protein WEB00_09260 [Dehalococcoidia bacterium]
MRTLHADLLAAQKETSVVPVLTAVLRDRHAGFTRPHPVSQYSGSEPLGSHDSCITSLGGVILRCRRNTSTNQIETNRVADPDASPNWSSWANAGMANVDLVACAANHDAGSRRAVRAAHTTANTLRRQVSDDEGATWAGLTTIVSGLGAVPALDIACRSDSNEFLCWVEGAVLKGVRVVNGVAGTVRSSGVAFTAASGVTCDRLGNDFLTVLTCTLASGAKVAYATYFDWDNDTWASAAAVRTVAEADAGLSVDYVSPFVDCTTAETRLTLVEQYSGGSSFERTLQCCLALNATASSERWSQPRPIVNVSGSWGMAVAADPLRGGCFWSRPDRVFRSLPVADVVIPQSRIESLEVSIEPFGGRCLLRLDDSDRAYSPAVESVIHPLSVGAQLEVSLGYRTASGDRTSTLPYFWVDSIETLIEDGRRLFVISARDIHSLLEAWHPRDSVEYRATRSVFQVIDLTAARAQVDYTTTSQSPNLTALLPDWFHDTAFIRWLKRERPPGWQKIFYKDPARPSRGTPPPGVNRGRGLRWDVLERLLTPPLLLDLEASSHGLSALSRVLSTVRDVAYGQDRRLVTLDLDPAEASVYDYGGAGHPLRRARYRRLAPAFNHVLTWGGASSTVVRSVPDWAGLRDLGRESLATVRDIAADSDSKADARADAVLRPSQVSGREDVIEALPNVGQELWDVVRVSETNTAQISAAYRRVTAIRLLYGGAAGDYLMWLTLGDR